MPQPACQSLLTSPGEAVAAALSQDLFLSRLLRSAASICTRSVPGVWRCRGPKPGESVQSNACNSSSGLTDLNFWHKKVFFFLFAEENTSF